MRQVIVTSILYGLDQKNQISEWYSWLKFKNLGLALGMALKILHQCRKGVKTKRQKILGVTGEKLLGRGLFAQCPAPHLE